MYVDEQEADRIGFSNFVKKGGNPMDAIGAIRDNLPLSDPEIFHRYKQMKNHAHTSNRGLAVSGFGMPYYDYDYQGTTAPARSSGGWSPDDWNVLIDNLSDSVADVLTGAPRSGYPGSYQPYIQQPQTQMNWGLVVAAIVALIIILVVFKK